MAKDNVSSFLFNLRPEGGWEDHIFWVPIKPLCKKLNINYNYIYKNIRKDMVLSEKTTLITMKLEDSIQRRKYFCLPESVIYVWLLTIRTNSPDFIEYRKECCSILFRHFNSILI